MKKSLLYLGALTLFAMVVSISGCDPKKQTAVNGPDGKNNGNNTDDGLGSQKPSFETPPHFELGQFQVGQWIQWRKTSSKGQKQCERWTLTSMDQFSIRLVGQLSTDCENWSPSYVESITFDPGSGMVVEDLIDAGTQHPIYGPHLNQLIDKRWYGSTEKTTYKKGLSVIGESSFEAFQLKGKNQPEYYNNPEHPFHAIALKFEEEKDHIKWKFTFDQSQPSLSKSSAKN